MLDMESTILKPIEDIVFVFVNDIFNRHMHRHVTIECQDVDIKLPISNFVIEIGLIVILLTKGFYIQSLNLIL